MAILTTRSAEWASAFLTVPGQVECGDKHFVTDTPDGTLVAVVDGLGHGDEAAIAADRAVETIDRFGKSDSLIELAQRCDTALRDTRGVAMALAGFHAPDRTMDWIGIGNIHGRVHRRVPTSQFPHAMLLQRPGVVGQRLPRMQTASVRINRGDVMILATDGVHPDFSESVDPEDHVEAIAERVLAAHGGSGDDALVFVIRYLG